VVIEDHSLTEVAMDIGITANAVLQAKSRVVRRLKDEMGELIAGKDMHRSPLIGLPDRSMDEFHSFVPARAARSRVENTLPRG
jgi:hypothetical protein